MKAKATSGYGQGWFKQSVRHSNARKNGTAGGKYKNRLVEVNKLKRGLYEVSVSGNSYRFTNTKAQAERLARRIPQDYVSYKSLKDSDGDGVPDSKDCQPFNPKAQDTYELRPNYDSRKSFYGKAKIETEEKDGHYTKRLYSYGTLVAEIRDGKPIVYGTYSQTTLRHIKEFLKQSGQKADTSSQIMKDFSPKDEDLKRNEAEQEEKAKSEMKTVAMVASLGEIFGQTKKEKNDWKKRMLKAGLEKKGLSFPEDWDNLSEDEKESRLDKALKELN